jgi:hypothetical protein
MSDLNERQWLIEHRKIQDVGSKVVYLDERKTEVREYV